MNAIKLFITDLWHRLKWRGNLLTFVELGLIIAILPIMRGANPQWFVEDGLVENIQLLVLSTAIIVACLSKNEQSLFIFVAMIVGFMIIRETNLFRGYFCARYLEEDTICRWKEFRFGWIADALRWLFVLTMVGYFMYHKLWKKVWQYICNAPIFVWDLLILGVMIVGGTAAEFQSIDNEILEECCELIAYLALTNCIWRYTGWTEEK